MGIDLRQSALMVTLECCPTGKPGCHCHDVMSHLVTLSWHWTNQSLASANNVEQLASKRKVSILKSLVRLLEVWITRSPKAGDGCSTDRVLSFAYEVGCDVSHLFLCNYYYNWCWKCHVYHYDVFIIKTEIAGSDSFIYVSSNFIVRLKDQCSDADKSHYSMNSIHLVNETKETKNPGNLGPNVGWMSVFFWISGFLDMVLKIWK